MNDSLKMIKKLFKKIQERPSSCLEIAMTLEYRIIQSILKNKYAIVHAFGLASIGGAIFLQILAFYDIFLQNYLATKEQNLLVLSFEIFHSSYGACYFVYVCTRLVKAWKTSVLNKSRWIISRLPLHSVGVACVGYAIISEIETFTTIFQRGHHLLFLGGNNLPLYGLTIIAVTYYIYIFRRFLKLLR